MNDANVLAALHMFFDQRTLPAVIALSPGITITDPAQFLLSHFANAERSMGQGTTAQGMARLLQLRTLLEKES